MLSRLTDRLIAVCIAWDHLEESVDELVGIEKCARHVL